MPASRDSRGRFVKGGGSTIQPGSVEVPFNFDLTGLQAGLSKIKSVMGQVESNLRAFGSRMTSIGGGISALFGKGIVSGLDSCIEKASDLNESITKTEDVFGSSAKAVKDWAKTAAESMGQSEQAALESASTLGNLVRGIGKTREEAAHMSMQMIKLAGDLSSFNNVNPKDVLRDIQSGLIGQVEPMRKYGVSLSETALKQQALDMGLIKTAKGTLPDNIKMQAAYALILAKTGTAQGNFAKTSDGLANQERILEAKTADLSAKLGTTLLPMKIALVKVGERLIGMFSKLPEPVQKFGLVAVGLIGALSLLLPALGAVAAAIGTIGIPITLAIAAFAALGAAFATNAGGIADTARQVLGPVAAFIQEQFSEVRDWFYQNLPLLKITIAQALSDIKDFWENHGAQVLAVVTPVWEAIKAIISTGIKYVQNIIKLALQVLNGDWSGAWNTVKDTLKLIWDLIVNLVGNATEAVIAAVKLFVAGLQEGVGKTLSAAINLGEAVWNGIKQGLANLWDNLKNLVMNAFANLASLGDKIVDAAKNLGNAVLYGIETALNEGVAGLAQSAVNTVKAGLRAAAHEVVAFVQNAKKSIADLYAGKLSEEDVVGYAAPTKGEVAKYHKEVVAEHASAAPAPTRTLPHYDTQKTGGGAGGGDADAKRKDANRAAITDAETSVKAIQAQFDAVSESLRKNAATYTAKQIEEKTKELRAYSEQIASLQKKEADLKLSGADPKNRKSAEADYRSDRQQRGQDYKERENRITEIKLDGLKKRADAEEKAGIKRIEQQRADNKITLDQEEKALAELQKQFRAHSDEWETIQSKMNEVHKEAIAESTRNENKAAAQGIKDAKDASIDKRTGKANLYDEEASLRELQKQFGPETEAWQTLENAITAIKQAQLVQRAADRKADAADAEKERKEDAQREKEDADDITQYEKQQYDKRQAELKKQAERTRQIMKPLADAMGEVVDRSLEKWRGFKALFTDIMGSVKHAFASMVKQLVIDWAKLQLLGGGRSGFGAGANASTVFGSLTSLFGGNKGAVPLGGGLGGVGTPGVAPGGGGMGAAGMGLQAASLFGKTGGRGLLGGLGGSGLAHAMPWIGGGLMLDQMLFKGAISKNLLKYSGAGALFGGLKKVFRFAKGGILPTGVPSVVKEPETGGELIVPRTPSMAIPVNTLKQIAGAMGGSGGRGGVNITVHGAPGQSVHELAHKTAWLVSGQRPTAKAGG